MERLVRHRGGNDALVQLFLAKTDANKVIDEQSMEFAYRNFNTSGGKYVGAEISASTADLGIGTDWTLGGVKALVVNFYGDPCNAEEGRYYTSYDILNDQMYVALEDGSTNVGIVKLPDMTDIKGASWHTWDISLKDPCFSSVDMNNVAKIYIGFGGTEKTGQSKGGAGTKSGNYDTVWFDDIRLYPPRCMLSIIGIDNLHALGDFTEDCNTDYLDFEIMATDWLVSDFCTVGLPAKLTNFTNDPSQWITGFDGNNALEFDGVDDYARVDNPSLTGLTSMTITAWVKRNGAQPGYQGVVTSRTAAAPGDAGDSSELALGSNGDSVGYCWNQIKSTWQFSSGLVVPDNTWTFIAMSVDPTGCSLYAKDANGAMQTPARHNIALGPLEQFDNWFVIGYGAKGTRYIKGALDDVRIYDYNLPFADINELANLGTEPTPGPVYWYKLDETEGLSAADSGVGGALTYHLPPSKANLTDPEPQDERSVNFRDYSILADNWLEQHLWP